jgi:addiction module RelB/DinJ family antitoxin
MEQVNLRVDRQLKENTTKIFAEMGLTIQDAFKIFLKKVENVKEIPFPLNLEKKEGKSKKEMTTTEYLLSNEENKRILYHDNTPESAAPNKHSTT